MFERYTVHVKSLIDARLKEDPELRITTPALLDHLAAYVTHSTFFREKREELYGVRQKVDENNHRLLLSNYYYLISRQRLLLTVDKPIHDCVSKESKRSHITSVSKTAQNSCEDVKP